MIKLAIICLVAALVFAILGFGGIAGTLADIAIILFVVALALFLLFIILGLVAGKKAKDKLG